MSIWLKTISYQNAIDGNFVDCAFLGSYKNCLWCMDHERDYSENMKTTKNI